MLSALKPLTDLMYSSSRCVFGSYKVENGEHRASQAWELARVIKLESGGP